MRSRLLTLGFVLAGIPAGSAADPVFSGPQVGEKLPGLKVALAYGKERGQQVDLLKSAEGKPVLLMIVNGANRPAAGLTRALMNYAEMQDGEKLFSAVVWLDRDPSEAIRYLNQAVSWWGVSAPVGVSVDGAEGPGSYGLNRRVNLTILVAHKGRVRANFALVQPGLVDADKILRAVTRLTEGTVPTKAEIVFLSKPTRKLPTARWQAAPRDVGLRERICKLLAAKDRAAAAKAAAVIEKYIGEDPGRAAAVASAAASLLQRPGELGTLPAVPHLRRWRKGK